MKKLLYLGSAIAVALALSTHLVSAGSKPSGRGTVTLIHIGDIHGHMVPRPNARSDSNGRMEGGLARMYTKIKEIRERNEDTLLLNTGDTVQGSAEALFTRGQALINILNLFGIDAHAPGNWDFVYGSSRFLETFSGVGGKSPLAPWNAVACNLYYSTSAEDPKTPFPAAVQGKLVLPPYRIVREGNLKIGILGFTTNRGVAAVGPTATRGFKYTQGDTELPYYIDLLRNKEGVDLLVLISEQELANNLRLTDTYPGVDVVLSADMHEETSKAIVGKNGTLLVEEGQDGTQVGELTLTVANKKVVSYTWTQHLIDESIFPNPIIAAKILWERWPFVSGKGFKPGQTTTVGGNTTTLLRPIDTVVGYTTIPLHRSNFSDEDLPAVVEGSSHNFLTDAFRWAAGSDFATLRGFRYGTHILPGPITMEDLYHFLPIAPRIAKAGPIYGKQLKDQVENSSRSVFDPNPRNWRGGWMFGYSGVSFDLDVYQPYGSRGSNIKVNGVPIDPNATETTPGATAYHVAGYWYADDPDTINNCGNCAAGTITPLVDEQGNPLDATEIVVRYLNSLPNRTVTPTLHRINLLRPLPAPRYGFPVMQPLQGSQP